MSDGIAVVCFVVAAQQVTVDGKRYWRQPVRKYLSWEHDEQFPLHLLAMISIPYTPGRNEAAGYLYGVYVDGSGNATCIPGSAYDANAGAILIPTGHLSVYGVGYTAPSAKLTDIGSHWSKDSIDYVVGRGLLSSTSETTFAPNTAMTRGMLVTALGRLAGVDVKAYTTNNFTDVKADSAFCAYIEWAYKKGIVQGIA